jgi:hypothetical protein
MDFYTDTMKANDRVRKHKMVTAEIAKNTPATYATDGKADKVATAKFFNPYGAGTWYMVEMDAHTGIAFGYVTGLGFDEWGYFSLVELGEAKVGPFNLPLERDKFFDGQIPA